MDEALAQNSDFKPIDLRDTGCIMVPDNQYDCGACYAYAINAAASYFNCMHNTSRRDI